MWIHSNTNPDCSWHYVCIYIYIFSSFFWIKIVLDVISGLFFYYAVYKRLSGIISNGYGKRMLEWAYEIIKKKIF